MLQERALENLALKGEEPQRYKESQRSSPNPSATRKEVEILSGKRLLIYFQFLNISLVFIQTR